MFRIVLEDAQGIIIQTLEAERMVDIIPEALSIWQEWKHNECYLRMTIFEDEVQLNQTSTFQ